MAILSKQLVNISQALKTHPFFFFTLNLKLGSCFYTFASIYSHVVFSVHFLFQTDEPCVHPSSLRCYLVLIELARYFGIHATETERKRGLLASLFLKFRCFQKALAALISCIPPPRLRLLWDPADAHVRPQTFPLWYKSLWRASIISSNNELSLDLTDVSVWMCQRASGLTERWAAAVHHFQGLPVSTGGTWDKPVSVRDYIWRLTLDQRHGGGNIRHADVWPHPQTGGGGGEWKEVEKDGGVRWWGTDR